MGHGVPNVGKMPFCRERFEIYFLERNLFFKSSWKYHLFPTVRSRDKNHWWKLRFGTESALVYNLSQWWLSSVVYIGISRPQWVKFWNCYGIYILNMELTVLVVLQLYWSSSDIHQPAYIIMMVADGLVPNRHQTINNYHAGLITLKRKCHHFDEIFITGCTGSCQNDNNFQCSQWWKFCQNDKIFVSVYD